MSIVPEKPPRPGVLLMSSSLSPIHQGLDATPTPPPPPPPPPPPASTNAGSLPVGVRPAKRSSSYVQRESSSLQAVLSLTIPVPPPPSIPGPLTVPSRAASPPLTSSTDLTTSSSQPSLLLSSAQQQKSSSPEPRPRGDVLLTGSVDALTAPKKPPFSFRSKSGGLLRSLSSGKTALKDKDRLDRIEVLSSDEAESLSPRQGGSSSGSADDLNAMNALPKGMPAMADSGSYEGGFSDEEGMFSDGEWSSTIIRVAAANHDGTNEGAGEEGSATPLPLPLDSRARLFDELVQTERNYVRLLQTFVEYYITPLKQKLAGTENEAVVDEIFNNIAQVLPRFDQYASYYANYDSAADALSQLVETDRSVADFLDVCDMKAKRICSLTGVSNYLILPIQRLPRYMLLVQNLLNKTPSDHPEYGPLCDTLAGLLVVTERIDQVILDTRRQRRTLSVGKRMAPHHVSSIQSKKLVYDTTATLTSFHPTPISMSVDASEAKRGGGRGVLVLLFYDSLLLVCEATAGAKKTSRRSLRSAIAPSSSSRAAPAKDVAPPLSIQLSVIWIAESGAASKKGSSTTVKLTTPRNTHTLEFSSVEDKRAFVEQLTEQLRTLYQRCTPPEHRQDTAPDMLARYAVFANHGWTYEGWWLLGVRHGHGKMTTADATYTGTFSDNQRHGTGQLQYITNEVYTGDWAEDEPHGNGHLLFPDGSTYTGGFQRGYKEGKGVFKSKTYTYDGDWERNMPNGVGTLVVVEPDKGVGDHVGLLADEEFLVSYEGNWKGGVPSGNGLMKFRNSSNFYTGQFKHGKFHGNGFINMPLQRFEGEFHHGLKHGFGKLEIFFTPQGENQNNLCGSTVYRGEFVNDMRHGKGKLLCHDGSTYEGEWQDDQFHGLGTLIYNDTKYIGAFVRGERHGQGQLTITSGNNTQMFVGNFHRNQITGAGTWTNISGTTVEGQWDAGTLMPKPLPSVHLPTDPLAVVVADAKPQLATAARTGLIYHGAILLDIPPPNPGMAFSSLITTLGLR